MLELTSGVTGIPQNNSVWNGTDWLPSELWMVPGCKVMTAANLAIEHM